jgi:hypothetical protein
MLSEKLPEKFEVRQIVSQRSRVLGGKFPKRNGQPYIISKGLKKEVLRGWSGVVSFSHWPGIHGLSQVNWFGLHLYWVRGNSLESNLLCKTQIEKLEGE